MKHLAAALSVLSLGACTSFNNHLTATPIAPGSTEIGATVSGLIVERGERSTVLPQVEASLRHGVTEGVDVGFELSGIGFEANARIRLIEARRLVLSVVPNVGFELAPLTSSSSDLWLVRAGSSLLLDVYFGDATLVLGVKPLALMGPETPVWSGEPGGVRLLLAPGAVVGFRLPLGSSWAIFPELNVHFPWDLSERRVRTPVFQGGIGIDLAFGS